MLTYNSALYWIHVSSGDFTTVEMNTIERTLNNSCSQSLARKRDSWKLQSMFSKHFSSGWIWMVTSVCWNISTLHYRGRNHPNRGFRSNLKVGLGISRTSVDSQKNPVYNVFHQIFFVQTKRFVGSFLTRRTCGQRSSRVAESKTQGARKLFLPSEFGICSQCQNVDEAEI